MLKHLHLQTYSVVIETNNSNYTKISPQFYFCCILSGSDTLPTWRTGSIHSNSIVQLREKPCFSTFCYYKHFFLLMTVILNSDISKFFNYFFSATFTEKFMFSKSKCLFILTWCFYSSEVANWKIIVWEKCKILTNCEIYSNIRNRKNPIINLEIICNKN